MSVTFNKLDRIITVDADSISIQDLYDAIRDYEDEIQNLDIPKIADCTGKDSLGGGLYVGLTLRLYNWKVKFVDQAGPDYVFREIYGGNLVAVDDVGDPMEPLDHSDYVNIIRTASTSATMVTSEGGFPTAAQIAAAVWDRLLASHTIDGSAGKTLTVVKKTTGDNQGLIIAGYK